MTFLARTTTARPEDVFQDFFRSYLSDETGSKYRKRLGKVAVTNGKSLVIDFEDLIAFDPALARNVVEKPDDFIGYASSAATAQMRVEDPEYAEAAGKIFARFRRLPERTALRKIGAEHLKKVALVDGIIVRATQVRPTIVSAVFRCRKCLETIHEEQAGELMHGPGSTCPSCKQRSSFELLEEQSKFKNTQECRIQERPEDLPPGHLPRYLDIRLEEDLVDVARPGDRVAVTSIVRAEKQSAGERGKLRTFMLYLDANFIDVVGKETEVVEITPEDEKKILEASQDPWVHRKLVMSLAPSIYGYEDVKEGILYMLFGGTAKQLPDGVNIRGDQNTLLIGDPGCLIGDERIILGDGTIAKIEELGEQHLQELNVSVLTGGGGAERDIATRFHVYHYQPTLEIITETGKSIRGTYNHPLLAVDTVNRTSVRRWKRLDEFKVGDRVAVVTGFPCYITRLVKTGFQPLRYTRGPRFRGHLPEMVTPELASVLGYLLGDGWVQRYRVGFVVAEGEKDILGPLCKLVKKLFGISPKVKTRKGPGRQVLFYNGVIGSQDLGHNLSFLREKRVPSLILKSRDDVVAEFLKWLYEADGTVFCSQRGCGTIGLTAKNIELLRDVQILHLRFGIHSRIIGNALLIKRGESILKFAQRIGFVSLKKRARLTDLEARAKLLKRFGKQRSERIVRVLHREPADVYDIEVPKTHKFIANGIVSHNTAKSQLLQYVSRIAPRGLYTSGRGTTAAGLCIDGDSMLVTTTGARTIRDVIEDQLKDNEIITETGETIARVPTPIELIAPVAQNQVLNGGTTGSLLVRNVSLESLGLGRVTQYYRLQSLFTIRIRTMLGKEIVLTPETKIACYDSELKSTYWKKAHYVREGDQILLAGRLPELLDNKPFHLQILHYADRTDFVRLEADAMRGLLHSLKRKYGTLRKAARAIGACEDLVYYRWRQNGLRLEHLNKICKLLAVNREDVAQHITALGYKSFRRFQTIQVPRDMKQVMEFLGCLYADGCLTLDKRGGRGIGVRFASGDYEECEAYRKLTKTLFGLYPKIEKDKRAECYEVRFTNKIVGRLVHSLGLPIGYKPAWLQINPIITSTRKDLLAAFLRGLILHDGWVCRKKSIGFSCSSKLMALQVDLCLQRFGIITTLRKRRAKTTIVHGRNVNSIGNYEIGIYDGESLKNFQENIGFSQSRNHEKLLSLISSRKFNHSNFIRIGDMIAVRAKQVTTQLSNGHVYDLTVEGSHSFLANGFIVHNTAAVLREKTGGMVLEAGALVLADKGVACLHPNSEVLVDGRPQKIVDLFDEGHAVRRQSQTGLVEISPLNQLVANLDLDTLTSRESTATLVARRWYEGDLIHVCMESGMELRLTPNHPVLDGNTLEWRPIGELRPGHPVIALQKPNPWADPSTRERLLSLASADYAIDRIGSVTLEPYKGYVYDLRVPNGEHFVTQGILTHNCIDELDKMRPDDRVAIHEALEQQTVCYDAQTEILTDQGWRRFPELSPGIRVATLNSTNSSLEYQEPVSFYSSSFDGEMISVRSRQVDLLVTPNHTMYVNLYKSGNEWFGFKLLRADSLPLDRRMRYKKNATWLGNRIDAFELPGCIMVRANGNGRSYHVTDPVKIPMDLWLEFLGYYLSEGTTSKHWQTGVPYRVILSQTKQTGIEKIERCLRTLGFKYTYIGHNFYINSKQLATYLHPLGKAHDKHIPRDFKQLSSEQLRILLDALVLGDGCIAKNGAITYFTSSRQLADDVTELALKIGWAANLYTRSAEYYQDAQQVAVTAAGGSESIVAARGETGQTSDYYTVSLIRDGQCEPNVNANGQQQIDRVYYSGKTYCVEVPNHIIYVRRNGKPVWCGNSVAKGGIVATLNARAAVLAAANPALGRYEPHRNVSENINLPVTILSRFDLIFIIKDQPDPTYDAKMSEHILALHRSRVSPEVAPYPPDFLRKYISYAKRIIPTLTPEAVNELRDFYLKMRSRGGQEAAVAITPRQLEALVRISEARARAFLRDKVTMEDAKSAIRIMTVSLSDVGVDVKTGSMDIDVIMTGKPRSLRDSFQKVIETVAQLERETGTVEETVIIAALIEKEKMEEKEARRLIGQLIKEGILYSPKPGRLKRTAG